MHVMKQNNLPNKIHIPGSSMTITVHQLVNQIESPIEDNWKMGRWSGTKYRLGKGNHLSVISAY
jgi:hypothetical protein